MKELQKKRIFHYSIFQIEMNPKQKLNKREQKDKVQKEENTLNTATSSVPFLICSNSKQDIPPKQERKPEIVSLHNNLSNLLKKLEVAKSKMELNYIPQELPCREKEKEYIRGFISNALESEGSATSLYISGMPGTGKTATTLEIINSFQKQNQYPSFKFIKINGMSLDKPQYVYTILCQKILSRTVKPATAAILLEEYFSNKKRSKGSLVVMLLDELDALITKRQTLLYNLFNWPAYSNSKLVIIAIANTMDLPERFLSKIKSRIGECRLVYQPYNEEQIQTILRSKLKEEENVFSNDALKLVSCMVAKSSGDIRRSLQLCKRAIELCIEECIKDPDHCLIRSDGVQYEHINISYSELFNSKIAEIIKSLRTYEKVAIINIIQEVSSKNQEIVSMRSIKDRLKGSYALISNSTMKDCEADEILLRLKMFGIISITEDRSRMNDRYYVELNIFMDEIKCALEKDKLINNKQIQF